MASSPLPPKSKAVAANSIITTTNTNFKLPSINLARLHKRLETLAHFGYDFTTGTTSRPAFSKVDMAARQWLMKEMGPEGAGLEVRMDKVGNVFGKWDPRKNNQNQQPSASKPQRGGGSDQSYPSVISGSHLDTSPSDGMFDGSLGVLMALECIQCLKENISISSNGGTSVGSYVPFYPLEVVATIDEEGCFGGMLGSETLAGKVTKDSLERMKDSNGVRLIDAMAACGLNAYDAILPESKLISGRDVISYIEVHIEQGPVLSHSHGFYQIGICTNICGLGHFDITLTSRSSWRHSGTTPNNLRADPVLGLGEFLASTDKMLSAHGTDNSRLNVGRIEVSPNVPQTLAYRVSFTLFLRAESEAVMYKLLKACLQKLRDISMRHNLICDVDELGWVTPSPCDQSIVSSLFKHCSTLGFRPLAMPTGAGYDAGNWCDICPTGLILIPSSHRMIKVNNDNASNNADGGGDGGAINQKGDHHKAGQQSNSSSNEKELELSPASPHGSVSLHVSHKPPAEQPYQHVPVVEKPLQQASALAPPQQQEHQVDVPLRATTSNSTSDVSPPSVGPPAVGQASGRMGSGGAVEVDWASHSDIERGTQLLLLTLMEMGLHGSKAKY